MIRLATPEDINHIIALCTAFTEEFHGSIQVPINPEDLNMSVDALLQSEDAMIFVADAPEGIIGVIAGIKQPLFFNKQHSYAQEIIWYVRSEHRTSHVGLQLIGALERWAKEQHCHSLGMVAIVENPKIAQVYNAMGYILREQSYWKVL